ncbi:hypothetical protein B0H16DRAFT_1462839 [Mycena metata]|uniref:Uncharacterized protein n=1 Tax=Mycena metata TaxID=1033252 RepID=A0AAD7IM34_9AGAR|nr:hypothetical protein B0H16DRAFT_1462839 [Mycena metata]
MSLSLSSPTHPASGVVFPSSAATFETFVILSWAWRSVSGWRWYCRSAARRQRALFFSACNNLDLTPRSLSERHQTFMNGSYVLGYIVKLELWIPRCATTFPIHPKLNNYDFLPIITVSHRLEVTGLISRPIGVSVWNMFYLLDAVVLTGRLWEHF